MPDTAKKNKRYFRTTIDLTIHLMLTLILAVIFRAYTGGWMWPVLVIVGGVFIDIDHFFDYFLWYGLKFDLRNFFCHNAQHTSGKCYVVFHSWEIVIFMGVFSSTVLWFTPLAIGMTIHLLIDYLINRHRSFSSFFLLYRWKHRFNFNSE